MARKRTVFACADCGHAQPKWLGQCPQCGAWNTMTRLVVEDGDVDHHPDRHGAPRAGAVRLPDVSTDVVARVPLGLAELDGVLGGGVVPGSLVLIGGEPGIGKSTLLLQASALLAAASGTVLYVSGEESTEQVKLRAGRMGIDAGSLYLMAETGLDLVLDEVASLQPRAVVIDSIQTVYLDAVDSSAGSVTQVRECAARLMRVAKSRHIPIFLVGHVTKTGDIAGPRVLEHMVDVVLYLEGDRFHTYRLLRCVKNRFGATHEVGVFEMRQEGLVEVTNPSAAFLAERLPGVTGSAVTVTLEGSRPLLVEIQALVSPSGAQVPRRTSNGVDLNRLLLLCAVLSRRLGLPLGNQDVFVNVVGGLKVSEPAVDLAVAAAIVSSARGVPIPDDLVIFGEIGLSGELRSVGQSERRLAEAGKLGYRRAVVPSVVAGRVGGQTDGAGPSGAGGRGAVGGAGRGTSGTGMETHGARTLIGALEVALGAAARGEPAGGNVAAPGARDV